MIPRATYRLQLTRDFPFEAARAIVPYLAQLGISHVYASPITKARSGSTHGYDVVDPTCINPELGGEEGFRALVGSLRAHGMGIIIDIVPNHMGVAGGENPWWNDVLRQSATSQYACFFDIDWDGPLILPILGSSLAEAIAAGHLIVDTTAGDPCLILYGEQRLPLRAESLDLVGSGFPIKDRLRAIVDAQHYRLVHWRTANDMLNWRRFFSINDLAGLRVEDPIVFEKTHRLYFDLFAEGLIDGVRVDHVDGLTDPAGYCRTLRERFDAVKNGEERAYVIVEKILAADEALPGDWGVDGTSGYDAMRDISALLHDRAGEEALLGIWISHDERYADFQDAISASRRDMVAWQFDGQLARCVDAFAALAASADIENVTTAMLRRAIERLLWVFPVYRTYGDGRNAPASDQSVREAAWSAVRALLPPGEEPVTRGVLDWLAGIGPGDAQRAAEAVRRFQQLSAPVAAKGVEDTAFYRFAPLLSANDVGSAPDQFAISIAEFHRRAGARGKRFPHAMLATATHDHKRGEDVRARLAVLSTVTDLWAERQCTWGAMADRLGSGVHSADRYQLFQTLFGMWPLADHETAIPELGTRVQAWLEKSLREARLRSSWEAPDGEYEAKACGLVRALLSDTAFLADMADFVHLLSPAAHANSLAQTTLKYCMPGVPDLYQGCELYDLSLVDPDNRRPVDYVERARMLAESCTGMDGEKLSLIARLLSCRAEYPELFANGDYNPIVASGPRAANVVALERRSGGLTLRCAVLLRAGQAVLINGLTVPDSDWWGGTRIEQWDALMTDLFKTDPIHFKIL